MKKQVIAARHYSGPIPHPSDLEKYEKILPGSADRILKMAEKQSEHRQNLERAIIFSDVQDSKRGQYFAFTIALVIILGGFWLIYIGKDAYGISAIVTSVATLVGVFIYGRERTRKEKKEIKEDKSSTL